MRIDQARVGLRIKDEDLGEGEIVELLPRLYAVMVRFDKRPHFDYNGGTNPCLRFVNTMEPAGGGEG